MEDNKILKRLKMNKFAEEKDMDKIYHIKDEAKLLEHSFDDLNLYVEKLIRKIEDAGNTEAPELLKSKVVDAINNAKKELIEIVNNI